MEIQAKTRSFRQPSFPRAVLFQTPLRDSTLMIKLKPSICKLHYGAAVLVHLPSVYRLLSMLQIPTTSTLSSLLALMTRPKSPSLLAILPCAQR